MAAKLGRPQLARFSKGSRCFSSFSRILAIEAIFFKALPSPSQL